MKLVKLEDLVKLPIGTIYAHYEPCLCRGLFKKGENVGNAEDGPTMDFYEFPLLADCLNGEFPTVLDTTPCRWAEYDHRAEFAVYEKEDIEILMAELREAVCA